MSNGSRTPEFISCSSSSLQYELLIRSRYSCFRIITGRKEMYGKLQKGSGEGEGGMRHFIF